MFLLNSCYLCEFFQFKNISEYKEHYEKCVGKDNLFISPAFAKLLFIEIINMVFTEKASYLHNVKTNYSHCKSV